MGGDIAVFDYLTEGCREAGDRFFSKVYSSRMIGDRQAATHKIPVRHEERCFMIKMITHRNRFPSYSGRTPSLEIVKTQLAEALSSLAQLDHFGWEVGLDGPSKLDNSLIM